MHYYKNTAGEVFAFSDIQTVPDGMTPLTQAEIDAHLNPPPAPSGPPTVVTAAQGGIALIQGGLMDAVQAVVDAPETPTEVKWAWSHATTWDRNSPALAYLSNGAGITSERMDELFVAAATIVA